MNDLLNTESTAESGSKRIYWLSAIALAGTAALVCFVSTWIGWWTLRNENRSFVEQSVGDTANTLARWTSLEFAEWKEEMLSRSQATGPVSVIVRPGAPPVSMPSSANSATSVPPIPLEFLQISFWQKLVPNGLPVEAHAPLESIHKSAEWSEKLEKAIANSAKITPPAFSGKWILRGYPGVFVVAGPKEIHGDSGSGQVVLAVIKANGLQKAFSSKDGLAKATLVDGTGMVLASSVPETVGASWSDHPLVYALMKSTAPSGQLVFADREGVMQFGGYRRIAGTDAVVLVNLPRDQAMDGVSLLLKRAFFAGLIFSALLGFFGFHFLGRQMLSAMSQEKAQVQSQKITTLDRIPVDQRLLTVVYGSLRGLEQLLDGNSGPEEVAEAIRCFFELAKSRVEEYQGVFERYAGASFVAVWGTPKNESTESWQAVRCALDVRMDFSLYNENRKMQGRRPLLLTAGIHTGMALAAKLGPEEAMSFTLVGGAHGIAKSLDQIALGSGDDFLISQATWFTVEGLFLGEQAGEAKLNNDTPIAYYLVKGYKDEQGKDVLIDSSYSKFDRSETQSSFIQLNQVNKTKRWLVNNGSQIVGPFAADQIAACLFSQEMDFDSECWAEGTGKSSDVSSAGIFTGTDDKDANLWVYDGKIIHGPLSKGFLLTAVQRGALPQESSFYCESSTITGWRPLKTWPGLVAANAKFEDSESEKEAA